MNWEEILASRASRMKASEIRELLKLLARPDIISFAGGIPDPELFPSAAFEKAFSDIFTSGRQAEALQYSVSEGYLPLREWLVGEMGRIGVDCTVDNIFITSGSQQALDYLGKLFLSPGDTALVTWPTYLGALTAFNAYEPEYDRLIENGNRPASDYTDAAAAKGGAVKFAYLSSDFANPTGHTLDLAGRERLLDLADEIGCAVIEDAAYQSLRFDGDPIPPILSRDIARNGGDIEKTRTVYCGSFSKTLSPGLRVGWVCASKEAITRLVMIKQAADLHSSTINQMAIAAVAEAGFAEQVAQCRDTYRARRDAMLDALERHMPAGVTWSRPEGGMFLWVTLPEHLDAAELLQKSLDTWKVAFVPGRAFYADGSEGNSLRLSFSCSDPETIEEGIRRLGAMVAAEL